MAIVIVDDEGRENEGDFIGAVDAVYRNGGFTAYSPVARWRFPTSIRFCVS